ncbi:MAG TPA: RluA family pseudouridine synthase, partial [Acidobacteriaceae bacterium]|nr:RluA family pseudouridine synthase [Acidobacteriaceae bacterium]
LYGAPARIAAVGPRKKSGPEPESVALDRNFLHAAELEFAHPITGKGLSLNAPIPEALTAFLNQLDPMRALRIE